MSTPALSDAITWLAAAPARQRPANLQRYLEERFRLTAAEAGEATRESVLKAARTG